MSESSTPARNNMRRGINKGHAATALPKKTRPSHLKGRKTYVHRMERAERR